jgi:glutaredoxin 3
MAGKVAPAASTLSRTDRMESSNGQPKITVYTTDPCARCIRAKTLLTERKLEFVEVNLAKDPVGRHELAAFTGRMTFPQIVIDGKPLGGFQELLEADEQGRL